MTDKVQKIREEVEKLKSQLLRGACSSQIAMETMCKEEAYNEVLALLDTMQEEPVNVWHDTSKEIPTQGSNILMIRKEEEDTNYPPVAGCFHGTNSRFDGRNWGYYDGFCYNEIEPPVKWAYVDELLKLDNPCNIGKDLQEQKVKESTKTQHVNDMCKENGNSLTQEPVSEELDEAANNALNNVLNTHEIVNVRSCLEMFKFGVQWKEKEMQSTIELAEDHAMFAGMEKMKEQMMKDAVGGYVIKDIEEGNGDFLLSADYLPVSMGLKDRQKVKVIVLKDE